MPSVCIHHGYKLQRKKARWAGFVKGGGACGWIEPATTIAVGSGMAGSVFLFIFTDHMRLLLFRLELRIIATIAPIQMITATRTNAAK